MEVFADLRGYAVILVNSKHKGVIFPYAPVSSFLVCVPKYVLYQFIGTAQNFRVYRKFGGFLFGK